MPAAESRLLLAPYLARYREVGTQLAAARRELAGAEAALAAPGGARSRRLRQSQQRLAAQVEAAEDTLKRLVAQIDDLLDPHLRQSDPAYLRLVATVSRCRRAAEHCGRLQGHLGEAARSARDLAQVLLAKPGEVHDRQFRSAWGARRYQESIREARRALPGLAEEVTSARAAIVYPVGPSVPVAPVPDGHAFAEVPPTLPTVPARPGRAHDLGALPQLTARIDGLATVLTGWRKLAERARRDFIRATYDRSLERPRPEPPRLAPPPKEIGR